MRVEQVKALSAVPQKCLKWHPRQNLHIQVIPEVEYHSLYLQRIVQDIWDTLYTDFYNNFICFRLHILSGRDLNCKSDQIKVMIKNLIWAAERLKKENIIGVIEPINPESKPGYFLNNYEAGKFI